MNAMIKDGSEHNATNVFVAIGVVNDAAGGKDENMNKVIAAHSPILNRRLSIMIPKCMINVADAIPNGWNQRFCGASWPDDACFILKEMKPRATTTRNTVSLKRHKKVENRQSMRVRITT